MTANDALEILRSKISQFDAANRGKGGRARAARELGYTPAVITAVLKGDYQGSLDNVAKRIIDTYGTVQCPVLGAIPGPHCHEERKKPFAGVSNIDLYRACRACERGKQ